MQVLAEEGLASPGTGRQRPARCPRGGPWLAFVCQPRAGREQPDKIKFILFSKPERSRATSGEGCLPREWEASLVAYPRHPDI